MGWCEGSHICNDVWAEIRDYVPDDEKAKVLGGIINTFSNEDADCWHEVMHDFPEYAEAMKIAGIYDQYFDNDYEDYEDEDDQ